jgi:hypothetical protein
MDTASYDSTEPWGVAKEVSTDGRSGYACVWSYKTNIFNPTSGNPYDALVGDESKVRVHLHRNQNTGDQYKSFWDGVKSQYSGLKESYGTGSFTSYIN